MTSVVLYTRPGCCMCDDARKVLELAGRHHPFELHERDIEQDEVLLRRYLERIPVVEINGLEAFELVVDESELERLLCRVEVR